MKGVSDLNGERRFWQSSSFAPGGCHEHRQDAVRATHGLPPLEDLPSHRRSLRQVHDMRRSIPRDGLRDIEVCLSAQSSKRYHMGVRQEIKRSTLADANEAPD